MNYLLLHQLLYLDREELFNNQLEVDFSKFSRRLGDKEKTPFIGFVGSRYENESIRVLMLGKSNAASKDKDFEIDLEIYAKAQAFKNSSMNYRKNYRNYANIFSQRAFKSWYICKYQNAFLNSTHLSTECIAYANILPFRYEDDPNKTSKGAYAIAFRNFTNKFIDALKPHIIVPLGAHLDQEIIKHIDLNHECIITPGISRNNGDTGWKIQAQSWPGINAAVKAYEELKSDAAA